MPGSGDRKQSVGSGGRRKASQSNSSAQGITVPELGSKPQGPEGYAPVNNFNSVEVTQYFDRTYKAALESFHHQGASNAAKPEMYKGSGTSAWGGIAPKGASMATIRECMTNVLYMYVRPEYNRSPQNKKTAPKGDMARARRIGDLVLLDKQRYEHLA
ncbi:hypothetical protein BGX34_001942 [Mortierella sp. NVP85]|nr:hypothetical protein BGX34_001942 [Mortierella sp. NVP85]